MISRIFILLFIAVTCTCCNSDDAADVLERELKANRQLWESSQVKNYSWNERLSCFCGGILERDIFVVNAVKDRVEYDDSNVSPQVDRDELYASIFNQSKTVDEAFDFIESLLNQDVASLLIEYDVVHGFPKLISIDYIENAIDDEIGYIYTDFNVEN